MKIIFESEEEKSDMVSRFNSLVYCPSIFDLEQNCTEDCEKCWRNALEKIEVKA